MLNRNIKTAIAIGKFGISGTRISKTFDGRWVKTIVLTRPKRGKPGGVQCGEAGQQVGAEKDAAQDRRRNAKPLVEPVGGDALNHEAAAERVEGEQPGQLQHHAPRAVEPEDARCAVFVAAAAPRATSVAGDRQANSAIRPTPIRAYPATPTR